MGTARKKPQKQQPPEPEINVTPLVDVVLVLLIIFMVITPALNEGEHVDLPSIVKVDKKRKEPDPIELTMASNGVLVLDNERVTQAQLEPRLVKLHDSEPERRLMIKADTTLRYSLVRDTFALAQQIGFGGVKLKVTKRQGAGGDA